MENVKATSEPKRNKFLNKVDEVEDIAIGIDQSLSEFRESIDLYCVDNHTEPLNVDEAGLQSEEQVCQFETRLRNLKARLEGIQSQVSTIRSEFRG